MEKTLILVKPDAMQRGLAGEIIARLERRGLKIVAMKMLWMDKALAGKHYAVHQGKPFYESLVDFISSCPIIAAVFEGPNAVQTVRNTMGATDPGKSPTGSIRGDLAVEVQHNLIHGSDSPENAAKEIALFFAPKEIVNYTRDIDKWAGLQ
ncbi:MAG: nucleoside-diphosphate kinase [Dehalococcoidia bacterium]|nr:nucleoside-diphosphate kinase [Dehalococcoidia bacterium]